MRQLRARRAEATRRQAAAQAAQAPVRPLRERRAEASLLIFAVLVTGFGYVAAGLGMAGAVPHDTSWFVGCVAVLALGAHLAVRRFTPRADPLILPITVLLTGLGLVLLKRLDVAYADTYGSAPAAGSQLMWVFIAVIACVALLALMRDYRRAQGAMYMSMAAALVLFMAPAFFPGDTYGAKRWVYLGPFSFQPGDFAKIALVLFFASYLSLHRDALRFTGRRILGLTIPHGRTVGPVLAVWVVSLLVLVFERDLGTSLLLFGVFIAMLYVATQQASWLFCGTGLAVVGAIVVGSFEPHVHGRVMAWLHPFDIYLPPDQRPAGLVSDQAAQVLFGFGSGGITGTGLGSGYPELIGFAGRSDFILTTIGEELGLAGVMAVLMLYGLLIVRGLRAALRANNRFGVLLASGVSVALAFQVFIVAAGVMGLMPFTGKTLPFLAQGGSAMVANWISIGLLLIVSHQHADQPDQKHEAAELGGLRVDA